MAMLSFHPALANEPTKSSAEDTIVIGLDGGGVGALGNSLPGLVRAQPLGLDYLELPLVLTADSELVVHNSLYLEAASDAGEFFPQKVDRDGRVLISDLTLGEVRQLRIWRGAGSAISAPPFPVPTLAEVLSLLKYLDADRANKTGIAPRLIAPGYYRKRGMDPATLTLLKLKEFGYPGEFSPALLMSLDGDELQRLKQQIMPELGLSLPLVQLIDKRTAGGRDITSVPAPYDHSWIFTRMGLRVVHSYADFVAIHTAYFSGAEGNVLPPNFLADLRALGLKTLVYPIAAQTRQQPDNKLAAELAHYLDQLSMDGILTRTSRAVLEQIQLRVHPLPEQPTAANPLRNINLQPLTLEEKQGSRLILQSLEQPPPID